jgi:hypothetical protein
MQPLGSEDRFADSLLIDAQNKADAAGKNKCELLHSTCVRGPRSREVRSVGANHE